MSRKIEIHFETEAEADAFKQGVEWVNDSTICVEPIHHKSGSWVVEITDEDGSDEENDV